MKSLDSKLWRRKASETTALMNWKGFGSNLGSLKVKLLLEFLSEFQPERILKDSSDLRIGKAPKGSGSECLKFMNTRKYEKNMKGNMRRMQKVHLKVAQVAIKLC